MHLELFNVIIAIYFIITNYQYVPIKSHEKNMILMNSWHTSPYLHHSSELRWSTSFLSDLFTTISYLMTHCRFNVYFVLWIITQLNSFFLLLGRLKNMISKWASNISFKTWLDWRSNILNFSPRYPIRYIYLILLQLSHVNFLTLVSLP